MSLTGILMDGIQKIASTPNTESLFQSFEGEKVALNLIGDNIITFTVKDGRLIALEGNIPNPTAMADIGVREFIRFIDGRTHFAELFTTEFGTYFQARKGEFYDLGGDFMLLGPVSDRLTKLYTEDPGFRDMVNNYKMVNNLERK